MIQKTDIHNKKYGAIPIGKTYVKNCLFKTISKLTQFWEREKKNRWTMEKNIINLKNQQQYL